MSQKSILKTYATSPDNISINDEITIISDNDNNITQQVGGTIKESKKMQIKKKELSSSESSKPIVKVIKKKQ